MNHKAYFMVPPAPVSWFLVATLVRLPLMREELRPRGRALSRAGRASRRNGDREMNVRPFIVGLAAMLLTTLPAYEADAQAAGTSSTARETRVPVPGASLYARTIGQGRPTIVLHGGPDFDHAYLL